MTAEAHEPATPLALPAALRYAQHGLRVVPIRPASKAPMLAEWPDRATSDPDTIRDWWTRRPDAGVGLVMGPQPSGDNIVAVDVDNHNPVALGEDTVHHLEQQHTPLPDTWRSVTGSGGAHILLRVPDGIVIPNGAGRLLGPGVDIRHCGGQIVVGPTIHPCGRPYEWETAPWDRDIADCPAWLLDILTATPDKPREQPHVSYDGPERPGDRWAAATPWRNLLEADGATYLATSRDGHELWARPGLAGGDLHTSASLYYKGSDVLYCFTSNWPGLDAETSYTKLGYLAATRHGGDHAAAARWLAAQGYGTPSDPVDDILGGNSTPDEASSGPTVSRLREALIHGDQITQLPAVEWLIPGVLQRNSLAALYGAPKSFKSFLAVDIALHLTNGRDWRRRTSIQPIRVLYVAAEGAPGVGPRAAAWCDYHDGHMTGMSWITIAPSLFKTVSEAAELAEIAAEYGCDLVIVDTLARSIPGAEENSAKDLGVVVEHLDLIRTVSGATVLVVHHMGKNGAQGMRGSSALHGAIDTGLEVVGDRESVRMMLADQKNAESGDAWWWKPRLHQGSVVLEPSTQPRADNEILELNVLKQLEEIGGNANTGVWQRRCQEVLQLGRPTFEKCCQGLRQAGYVAATVKGNATVWAITPTGSNTLRIDE